MRVPSYRHTACKGTSTESGGHRPSAQSIQLTPTHKSTSSRRIPPHRDQERAPGAHKYSTGTRERTPSYCTVPASKPARRVTRDPLENVYFLCLSFVLSFVSVLTVLLGGVGKGRLTMCRHSRSRTRTGQPAKIIIIAELAIQISPPLSSDVPLHPTTLHGPWDSDTRSQFPLLPREMNRTRQIEGGQTEETGRNEQEDKEVSSGPAIVVCQGSLP